MSDSNWDIYAEKYSSYAEYNHFLSDFFDILGDISGKRILDLGCSNGLMCRLLATKGAEMVGVDISPTAIQIAKTMEEQNRQDIEYYVADATDLSVLGADEFDIVVAVNVLCSLGSDKNKIRKALDEAYRVLKSNGSVVAVNPHPAFEHNQASKTRQRIFPSGFTYFNSGSIGKLRLTISGIEGCIENIHWTFEDYAAFFKQRFCIKDIREPKPDEQFISLHPDIFLDKQEFPIYLILHAVAFNNPHIAGEVPGRRE